MTNDELERIMNFMIERQERITEQQEQTQAVLGETQAVLGELAARDGDKESSALHASSVRTRLLPDCLNAMTRNSSR